MGPGPVPGSKPDHAEGSSRDLDGAPDFEELVGGNFRARHSGFSPEDQRDRNGPGSVGGEPHGRHIPRDGVVSPAAGAEVHPEDTQRRIVVGEAGTDQKPLGRW